MWNENDFMGGTFDLNGDGHTDMSEEYAAYQSFQNYCKATENSSHAPRVRHSLDGWTIFVIILVGYEFLKLIAYLMYH